MRFTEVYSYAAAGTTGGGLPVKKRLQVNQTANYMPGGVLRQANAQANLDASYSYNSEGRVASVKYPYATGVTIGPYTYGFDTMGRPSWLTDQASNLVAYGVSYGPANELLRMSYSPNVTEARTYNSMLQLTSVMAGNNGASGLVNMQYVYPAGANNGKVCLQRDLLREDVQYSYDKWNRLSSASASAIAGPPNGCVPTGGGAQVWAESYTYDGYGSLTDKNVMVGAAPPLHVVADPATNRISGQGQSYDANGNMTVGAGNTLGYDAENRLSEWTNNTFGIYGSYGYDSQNKRVWVWGGTDGGSGVVDQYNNPSSYQLYFYGLDGKRLGVFKASLTVPNGGVPTLTYSAVSLDVYFGSRRLAPMDRLGSDPNPGGASGHATYYPYGEDKAFNPSADAWKFGTYWRDGITGLDYADQRHYASVLGRFTSADPYVASAGPSDPGSWNRYAYVEDDPVNYTDGTGQFIDDGCLTNVCQIGVEFDALGYAELVNHGGGIGGGGPLPCTLDGLVFNCGSAPSLYGSGAAQLAPTPPVVGVPVLTPTIGGVLGGILTGIIGPIIGIVFGPVPTGGWGDMFPTVEQLRQYCTPNGAPVVSPSTNVRNRGGRV